MASFPAVALSYPQPEHASTHFCVVGMFAPQTFSPLVAYLDDVCTIFLFQFCITESVVILKFTEGKGVNDIIPKDSIHFKSWKWY